MRTRVLTLCLTGLLGCGGSEDDTTEVATPPGEASQAIRGSRVSFNGDIASDLLWREQSTGNMFIWVMQGPSLAGTMTLPALSPSFTVQAATDFGGPSTAPDLAYQAVTPGNEAIRYLSSTATVLGQAAIENLRPTPSWYIAASGDFNNDNRTDLVLHNRDTGQYFYRYMDGATSLGNSAIAYRPLPWFIVGAVDLSRDNRTDLIWRNKSTGQNEVAVMDNLSVLRTVPLPTLPLDFYLGATAEYSSDAHMDLVWHNPVTGQVVLWWMGATTVGSAHTLGTMGSNCPRWFSQSSPPPSVFGCRYLVGPR
ncbi:FG-GAP repeat domain-containing protein [Pyxidicoccus xibeiensis]|uniref:FG-GAP repeat domain-containing protein n=1 Tax=Pyxidicoccus xibeiensis TaxID=2906759 RepID=UPI0020A77C80|nr:VCBS repeat-containing protein [Pyxidicoccus xibeiensis]MCP3145020.1 VCBS repeat-containing protein [Pyxidicoccus xibeiensis]